MKLPVSVVVCTLNEETKIKSCLHSIFKNRPSEVIVVDGGSSDRTTEIAVDLKVKLIVTKKGLAHQRDVGLANAKYPYIFFIDADDRLTKGCLRILYNELKKGNYDAIQTKTIYKGKGNYWQRAMEYGLQSPIKKPVITNMVGRPALYLKKRLKKVGFDGNYFSSGIGNEDTDLAIRFEKAGFIQAIGTGVSKRVHADTLGSVLKKIRKYGRGDARIIFKYPEKMGNIVRHLLINYPIVKSWKAIKGGRIEFVLFYLMTGLGRFLNMVPEYFYLTTKYARYSNFKKSSRKSK